MNIDESHGWVTRSRSTRTTVFVIVETIKNSSLAFVYQLSTRNVVFSPQHLFPNARSVVRQLHLLSLKGCQRRRLLFPLLTSLPRRVQLFVCCNVAPPGDSVQSLIKTASPHQPRSRQNTQTNKTTSQIKKKCRLRIATHAKMLVGTRDAVNLPHLSAECGRAAPGVCD
jgi:hypothetical protein